METTQYESILDPQMRQLMFRSQMEQRCLTLSGDVLLKHSFLTLSGSDWLVQHNFRWNKVPHKRETYVHPRGLLLLHFLCAVGRMRPQICQMEEVTLKLLEDMALTQVTAWLTRHMLSSHTPTDISYTVNVKMWKICTFGKLKNITVGVFWGRVVVRNIVKKRENKHQDSILGSLFPWPRLELHIKDCDQTQTSEGCSGCVHGYKTTMSLNRDSHVNRR